MRVPDDKRKRSPVDRFRKILSAGQEGDSTPVRRTTSFNPPKSVEVTGDQPAELPRPINGPAANGRVSAGRLLPILWTVASILSLLINAILLIALIGILQGFGSPNAAAILPGVGTGLYSNLERLDQAHIKTSIPVQTTIPLDISVPIQTTTNITLAEDVVIQGAHVKINTALFNIDAPASVTLPAGTALTVALSMDLPVKADVPISLNVPVDIALQNTDMHTAITGLEDTLRPLACLFNPAAMGLNGQGICR
jgi:hypothetical protein